MEDSTLHVRAQYMYGQWSTRHFGTWQVFATPTGFASTNNPVKTFNALLKPDYTLRRRLKMGSPPTRTKCVLPGPAEQRAVVRVWGLPDANPRAQGGEADAGSPTTRMWILYVLERSLPFVG
ncbi:hypothetical protein L917_14577 [Phytophthora nicotianae]|uniref:Uncharacterized protein n=1 Tax=Phytophthora nicotianae TaxID=4792 RepID=W2KL94_PHYNI|nr:hypothetical protein L917_14577 [Phytophthora nicotianae]